MGKFVFIIVISLLLSGCVEKKEQQKTELLDGITNVNWIQEGEYKLFFTDDGKISYYSVSAGNPYNNFDLCENYQYNAQNKEFTFDSDACSMKLIKFEKEKNKLNLLVDGNEINFIKEDK